jgi:hypothetical protein
MSVLNQKLPKNQGIKHSQQGSAIVWVFIMIILFAALTYALNQNTRGGGEQISKKQAELAAIELLDSTTAFKNTVQGLLIDGCGKDELSFEHPLVGMYQNNPNAPSDFSCHIFKKDGGNLNLIKRNKNAIDSNGTASLYYNIFVNSIDGVGTSEPEVYTFTRPIKDSVCEIINENLGHNFSGGLPEANLSSNAYNGDISSSGKFLFGDDPAESGIENKLEGCFVDNGCTGAVDGKCNAYIKVLIEQ